MGTRQLAASGVIAALYAALTLLTILFLQSLSWGPVQIRVSEALVVLAIFTRAAIPGLTMGCAIANFIAIPLCGFGALGLLDVFFGSLATFFGALWCWKFRERVLVAFAGPVFFNALIVSLYMPFIIGSFGITNIPLTDISIPDSYISFYLISFIGICIGQFVSVYGLGGIVYTMMRKRFKSGNEIT